LEKTFTSVTPIQMVDLKSQYLNLKTELENAVLNCMASTAYINGPEVKRFQQNLEQFLDVKHVIPCANGTDALQIAMMALGLKMGDEVIVPAFTYVATAEVIALLKLTPVMVDVDPKKQLRSIQKRLSPCIYLVKARIWHRLLLLQKNIIYLLLKIMLKRLGQITLLGMEKRKKRVQ
jgi:dTDP-4-amino-4,6-dideoxygalactose transaminase